MMVSEHKYVFVFFTFSIFILMIEEMVTYLSTTGSGSAISIVMLKDWSCRL
jgi:hypothetical protein